MEIVPPTRPALLNLIGGTPLIELTRLSPKPGVRIFAKLEGQNPSGSVKDRIALALVEAAEAEGLIKPGDTLVEASSGNTGIALAMVARQKGYPLKVVIPMEVVPSIADVFRLYGIEVIWCRSCVGMKSAIDRSNELAEKHGWHNVAQFTNPINVQVHHDTTGVEIVEDLPEVDVFVAGIGTGGTLMGVGTRLREHNPNVQLVGVEPRLGDHLQGLRSLGEGYRPPLLDLDLLNSRMLVDSATAITAAETVIREEGISAGVSAGATLAAALRRAEKMDRGNIVVMFSDGGWKYIPARPWDAARAGDQTLDDIHWW